MAPFAFYSTLNDCVRSTPDMKCPKMGHNSNPGNCLFRLVQSDGFRASFSGRLNEGGRKRIPDECDNQSCRTSISPARAVSP